MIEIGENDDMPYMYVNYYFKYASNNKDNSLSDIDFVEFLCKLGYYFGIRNIILYTEYTSCDISKNISKKISENDTNTNTDQVYHGGNYCIDYYTYLKLKTKRFSDIDKTELKPYFSYYDLDRLRTISPRELLRKDDRDELYQVYNKTYNAVFNNDKDKDNVADFYVWIVEHHCVFLHLLVDKMNRIYAINNPFDTDFYILDSSAYLYNHNLILEFPSIDKNIVNKLSNKNTNIDMRRNPKNEYRLQYYKKSRVVDVISNDNQ